MTRPREIVVLGATGSIGTQAADVLARHRDRFRVRALAASGSRPELLAQQAADLGVATVAVASEDAAPLVRAALADRGLDAEVLAGEEAVEQVAGLPCDVVLNGITGARGLEPTLAALRAGSTLALANKESLIIGGPLVKAAASPGQIVPVDSEHSALAQCLRAGDAQEVARLILTASGGPFRGRTRADLAGVTAADALAHPTWSMGPVITVNSASLVNKGLELIEAHLLFDVPLDRIDVVVHPQSVVHSMVEFVDGAVIAQCSPPDMRLPIALGLSWPQRLPSVAPACDWTKAQEWQFLPLDEDAFGAVTLARRCAQLGATYPAVYNASNEEGVAAFLDGRIGFLDIVDTVSRVVAEHVAPAEVLSLDDVRAADAWGRATARRLLGL
ncbi:MAG: 1-deoxy-D-xylulose-5-phosphate reductoisomerase [Kineosporiaceae bacterium]